MNRFEIAGLLLAIALTVLGLFNINQGNPDEVFGAYFDLALAGIMGYLVIFWKVPEDEEVGKKKKRKSKKDIEKKEKLSIVKDFIYYSLPAIGIGVTLYLLVQFFSKH